MAAGGGGTTFSGTVIKGPLVNAFVFFDENGNGLFDAGEPNFTTSSTGGFSISSSAANPKLIVTTNDQTIDTTTGTILSGMTFKSPLGASVVSPLTTMMEETGLSVAEIKSVLGLPATVNPLTFNPYAPGVNAADALAAEQVSAQTMVTLAAFAATAAGTGISQQDAFAAALSALSSVMQSKSSGGGTLDLTDPTDLAAVQSAFTTAVGSIPGVTADQTTAINGIIGDATTAIQNVNNKIASITNTDLSSAANGNIFGLLQVLQDQVEKAAEDEKTTPGSGTIGFTDPTAVDNAATNSAPTDIDLSASSISEDASSLVVGVLTTTDDSTSDFNFSYEIAEIEGSIDHSAFSINPANGELSFGSQPDFETKSSYTITIIATDEGGKSFSETFTITVTDGNEPPVFDPAAAFSTPENQLGTGVTPVATDQNGDTLSYSIVGGADGDKFELDGTTGELKFKVAPNFESPGSANADNDYNVQIQADDGNGGKATQTFTITVTDANDPPVFTSNASYSVQENQSDTGYTPVAVHPQGLSFTFSIGGGADADKFKIVGGVLRFKDAHIPDYENPADSGGNRIYDVQIHATDSAGSIATQDVTISVTDVVNENAPVFASGTTFNAEENQLQTGYTPAASDADGDTVSFSINGGSDADLFELDGVTGALKFRTAPDYENPTDSGGDRTYNVQILASDGAGRSATQNVSITVTDIEEPNQPPTFTSSDSFNAAENQVSTGYTPAVTDPENDSVSFSIIGGADASLFELDGVSGALKFKSVPNFEVPTDGDTNNIYQVEVEADDGNGGTATQLVTITVTDEAEAPSDPVISSGSTASAPENQVATGYTPAASDADGDTVSFSINGGADADKFELDGVSGALKFKVAPDYEANGSANNDNDYIVQILASDGTGRTDTQTVTVSVTNLVEANQPPTITSGGAATAAENQVTTSYTPVATDPENDSVSFSIIGGADADLFELDSVNGALKFKVSPDFEAHGSSNNDNLYEVQIQASDGNGGTDTQTVNVTVTDENEGPDFTIISSFTAAENQIETGYTPSATDEDGDTITYTISGGADAGDFELVGGALRFKVAPDFENPTDASSPPDNVYEVQIQANDGNGGTATQAANITVTNVNEVPSFTSGTSFNAAENQLETGYTPAATDPENDTVTFTINGGADADNFELVGGALKFKTAPDFDTPGSADNDNVYAVQIQASDGNSGTASQTVAITVTDVNENQAPTFGSATTSTSVPENTSGAFYTAAATDADSDSLTYSVVGGADGDKFEFDGTGLTFKSAPDYETPTDNGTDNVYEVQIQADDGNGGTATQTVSVTVSDLGPSGFVINGVDAGDLSGRSVSYAGDINDDGYADVIIGAPWADPNLKTEAGESYVLFGATEGFGSSVNLSSLDGNGGFTISGIQDRDRVGYSVSAAGDVNNDGSDDFLIGAYDADRNDKIDAGEVYLLYGKSGDFGASFDLSIMSQSDGSVITGIDGDDFTGIQVSNAGDLNKDSFDDIIIGANAADPNGNARAGKTYVIFGNSNGLGVSFDLTSLDGTNGFVLNGIAPYDRSGQSVSEAGDINGDGYDDIILGANAADPNGTSSGESYVIFGKRDGFSASLNLSDLDGASGFTINGIYEGDEVGISVSTAGDFNGDGFDDLIIGAHHSDSNGRADAGQSYVIFGKAESYGSTFDLSSLNGTNGFAVSGISAGDRSGRSVSSAGDVNNDGFDDIIVGAYGANPNNLDDAGAAYVVLGKAWRICPSAGLVTTRWQ